MSYHYDDDNCKEYRKLLCDGSLVSKCAEGCSDKDRKYRDNELCYDAENDTLELLQNVCDVLT